jgi:hypothetical protein
MEYLFLDKDPSVYGITVFCISILVYMEYLSFV